jgi:CRISPR-associated protein Csx10
VNLWLLSDMALLDKYGQPSLIPDPGLIPDLVAIGLNGSFVAEKSFISSRRYNPYNSARGGYDQQRQVIAQGSVLQFELQEKLSSDQRRQLLCGVGLYRECGLGQVAINPHILNLSDPMFLDRLQESLNKKREKGIPQKATAPVKPDTPLIRWLGRQSDSKAMQREDRQLAMTWEQELRELYRSARLFQGTPPGVALGPGRNQWGRILELARIQRRQQNIVPELQSICRQNDADWNVTGYLGSDSLSFGQWLEVCVNSKKAHHPAFALRTLARIAFSNVTEMTLQGSTREDHA